MAGPPDVRGHPEQEPAQCGALAVVERGQQVVLGGAQRAFERAEPGLPSSVSVMRRARRSAGSGVRATSPACSSSSRR
jgi:hypothetical protein